MNLFMHEVGITKNEPEHASMRHPWVDLAAWAGLVASGVCEVLMIHRVTVMAAAFNFSFWVAGSLYSIVIDQTWPGYLLIKHGANNPKITFLTDVQ